MQLRKKSLGCLATLFCVGPAFVGHRHSGARSCTIEQLLFESRQGSEIFLLFMADKVFWDPPSRLRSYSLGVKQTGNETTSPLSCAESENAWSCTSFVPRVGIALVITRKEKDKSLCIWKYIWKIANVGPNCGPCGWHPKFILQNTKKRN